MYVCVIEKHIYKVYSRDPLSFHFQSRITNETQRSESATKIN